MTTKPEHDNAAGELPALPRAAVNPVISNAKEHPSYCEGTELKPAYYTADQMHAYAREALAASHRERIELGVPNGANCAQSEVDPLTQYAADFIDGWIEDESEEVKRNWTRVRKAVLAPPFQPIDSRKILERRLSALAPDPATAGTPSSRWSSEGKPDPHGAVYDCERAQLAHGDMTDDELANEVFLCNHRDGGFSSIGLLNAAKDRIRWLSRRLEEAKATPAAAVPDGMVLVKAYASCGQYADDQPGTRAECSARIKMGDPCERCPRRVAAPANRPADKSQSATVPDAQRQLAAEFRDRFMTYGRDMRARNFEEVRYWLDQYRNLAQDMLAASPVPAQEGLAERITDYLCEQEYDIGGREELLTHVRSAILAAAPASEVSP